MVRDPNDHSFRFYDNREKYLLFVTTCDEKHQAAKRIGLEFEELMPRPPALRLFQAGAGEGALLNRLLRQLHYRWPTIPFLVVIKENNPEFIRMAVRSLADRFCEHPELVVIFTNQRFSSMNGQGSFGGDDPAGRREIALEGTASHAFAAQINAGLNFVNSRWFRDGTLDADAAYLVLYRADQKFALNRVIPDTAQSLGPYDCVVASHPFQCRLSCENKVRSLLGPLARCLAPGGRMIAIQSKGGDPGLEIIQGMWPGENPFPTTRAELQQALKNELAGAATEFSFPNRSADEAEFTYRLLLSPDEVGSAIGTSTLLAAWNAATYVAQIDDFRLTKAMSEGRYLEVTAEVLQRHDGLWFRNESLIVNRAL